METTAVTLFVLFQSYFSEWAASVLNCVAFSYSFVSDAHVIVLDAIKLNYYKR